MEQRIYRGNVNPDALADYLVQYYDPQKDIQAQKLGQGPAVAVQIAGGDDPNKKRHALTVAIARNDSGDLVVTMGEQEWITPEMATYAAMIGLVALLITPWALFALLWPVSAMLGSRVLPGNIWTTIDTYLLGQGATPAHTQELVHPAAAPPPAPVYGNIAPAPPPPATVTDDAKTQRLDGARRE